MTALLFVASAASFGQNAATKDDADIQEVVVTGTQIRGIAPIGAPTSVVDTAAIKATGTTNTADLLATQPALNSFNTTPIGGNQAFRSTASTVPGMRGLPGTAVLVMLDGHRLVGDSPLLTTADPSSIPAGAIDRIEVIQDGGSATYGSDAVAGVINIILKKNFSGSETTVTGTGANDYGAGSIMHTMGRTWDGGSALLTGSYERNGYITNSDRDYYLQDLRRYGGIDGLNASCGASSNGVPALNVLMDNGQWYNSANGAHLPVTTSSGLTTTTPARNTPPGLTQGVSCDPQANNYLVNPVRRWGVVGNVREDLNSRVHLFADYKVTDTSTSQRYQPTNLVVNDPTLNVAGSRQTSGTLIIPGTNPFFYAPPGYTVTPTSVEQVFVNSRTFGSAGDVWNYFRSRSYMLDVGGSVDLWSDWQATSDMNIGYSTSTALNLDSTGPNPNALEAAENGTTAGTALDPFGGRTNPNVIAAIMNWPLLFEATQRIYDLNVRADGTLFRMGGNAVKLAVGLGNRHEHYNGADPIGVPGQPNALQPNAQDASRIVNSINGELAIPIFGDANGVPFARKLAISIAARYDHYSDFGGTTNPKFGISWSPINDLSFRASYGTSFHAPQLADSFAIDTRATANITTAGQTAPANFPTALGVPTIGFAGGHPNLLSEDAHTRSFGVDFAPEYLPGFNMNLTWFGIDYRNEVIIPQNNAATVNNPALAGTVFIYNKLSDTGCSPTGAAVPAGTGGPCYGPIPQATLAALLDGVRAVNFTGIPTTWYVTDLRRTNLGSNLIEGIDFNFGFHHEVGSGTVLSSLSGERLTKFKIQSIPGSAYNDALTSGVQYFQNDAGAQSVIPWHVRASLGWQEGQLSTQAAFNYTGHYDFLYVPRDYSVNPNGAVLPNKIQSVRPFATLDVNAIWEFHGDGFYKGLKTQINVYNLGNQRPPLQYSTGNYAGFASPSASPLGRTARVSLTKSW